MSAELAARIAEIALAFAVFWQTLELLILRPAWDREGVWRIQDLLGDYDRLPKIARAELGVLFLPSVFLLVLWVRLAACVAVALFPLNAVLLGWIFLSTCIIAVRWRGTFNGGSDSITAWSALGLFLSAWVKAEPHLMKFGLGLIAVQLTASYFLAGFVKARNRQWWTGEALALFMATPGYDSAPERVRKWVIQPHRARLFSVGVIFFELAFPLAWRSPWVCAALLAVAFVFHLGNFLVFGLNRFVWAWLAAYPALFWIAST